MTTLGGFIYMYLLKHLYFNRSILHTEEDQGDPLKYRYFNK